MSTEIFTAPELWELYAELIDVHLEHPYPTGWITATSGLMGVVANDGETRDAAIQPDSA
jgi:hypothetical protein